MSEQRELFEVPNLDDFSMDPADHDAACMLFDSLASYSRHKARAMRHRLKGEMGAARTQEEICEGVYKRLPEWAKW